MILSLSRRLAFVFALILGNVFAPNVFAAGSRLVVFEGFYRLT